MLGAAGFALAAIDALGGLVGRLAPMPLQAVEHVLGILALKDAMVVGIHHGWNVDVIGAGQTVAAAGAEAFEGFGDAVADGLDVLGVVRLEV